MGNVCLSKHGKGTVKTQHKRWKMVHLSREVESAGLEVALSECQWVSAEWAWRPRNLMHCIVWRYDITTSLGNGNFQLCYNLIGPLQYMQSIIHWNVVMQLMTSGILIFHLRKSFLFFLTHSYRLDPCPSCATIQHFNISVVI